MQVLSGLTGIGGALCQALNAIGQMVSVELFYSEFAFNFDDPASISG